MTTHQTDHRRSKMTAAQIQQELDLIRLAYRERQMEPLNHYRITKDQWVGYGLLATALLVPAIAAIIFCSL